MSDDFEIFPMSALFHPGTVALPSPFPTVGKVWLPSPEFEHMPGIAKGTELIAIGNAIPPSRTIVRYVRVQHVSAIFLLDDTTRLRRIGRGELEAGDLAACAEHP